MHNDNACKALMEYDKAMQRRDASMFEQLKDANGMIINGRRLNTPRLPFISMEEIAFRYGVTIGEMKQHWNCIKSIESK